MSYRQSLYPGAFSHSTASSASSTGGPSPAHHRLLEKQREFTAFASICQHAEQLAAFLDAFAHRYDTLDGGSEAVGDVVEHWQNVFRVTGLALASLTEQRASVSAGAEAEDRTPALPADALPAKLVRIPVRQDSDDAGAGGSGAATPVPA
ncbi:DASH complex subunit dad2 [Rhodotorula kratochvilovae]